MRHALTATIALLVFAGTVAPAAAAGPATGASVASTAPTASGGDGNLARTAPTTPGGDGDLARTAPTTSDDESDDPPDDPEEDVLGWEEVGGHGIWYNESIDVDNSDGLDQSELDRLVARTMARIEHIRELEFEGTVPVEIRSREQYRRNVTAAYANVSNPGRVHQNVKYEATFMIAEGADAIEQLASNRAASTLGYYSPARNRIVIISDDSGTLQMDELTLSHELAHAVQDQTFDITRYERTTEDRNNAISGIVEGDAHYVEQLYAERCNDESHPWNGTCVRPTGDSGGGGGDFHIGVYLVGFQPYSDGPAFVHRLRQEGGWEAVNRVYENPPASAEQVAHPEKYPDDEPATVTVEDRSNDDWEVLRLGNGSVDYASFGEAGLFSMFWYPSYRERSSAVVPYRHLLEVREGSYDAYNYDYYVTNGWDGDRLYPYVPTDADGDYSYERTGYVWKLEWDTENDAEQFVGGYEELLDYYGAREIEDRRNTYLIPDDEEFSDAFYVQREGTTVWIVNAPSVAELSAVREGAAPAAGSSTDANADGGGDAGGGDDTTPGGNDGTGGQETPGFGVAAAVLAVLAVLVLGARRHRR